MLNSAENTRGLGPAVLLRLLFRVYSQTVRWNLGTLYITDDDIIHLLFLSAASQPYVVADDLVVVAKALI